MLIIPTDTYNTIQALIPIILAHCSQWQMTEDNNKKDIIKAGKTSHKSKSWNMYVRRMDTETIHLRLPLLLN